MSAPRHIVILAAGQGTRMKSALPKVLHPLAGRPMIGHVLDTALALDAAGIHVVRGHGGDQVQDWVSSAYPNAPLYWATQVQQKGTAHAVLQALPAIPDDAEVLVMYGDVPLTSASTLQGLLEAGQQTLAVLTVELSQPRGYGRILRDERDKVIGIVEEKDASDAQRAIHEINTGLMAAPAARLRGWLSRIGNKNANAEFYLTDAVALAVADGLRVETVAARCSADVEGVNDKLQLARLERLLQQRQAEALMREGVQLADPARFDLRGTLQAGRDVKIDVGCVLEGTVVLGDRVQLGPYCVLRNVRIAADTVVSAHSVLEDCEIGEDCRIGPFARVRPGSVLEREAHVGNFVELKNTRLGAGAKANHLAYVGDAQVGARTNIGAGVITCNYDGANKHRTEIGEDVFVGSDTQLVAPVRVGDGATIAAGSTITREVPAGGLTIARAREQKTIAGWQRPRKKR